jgi:fatty acid synthase
MEKQMDIPTLLIESEDIVISGISGRFPESDTIDEFAQNLYNNVDMITEDDRRWPTS